MLSFEMQVPAGLGMFKSAGLMLFDPSERGRAGGHTLLEFN